MFLKDDGDLWSEGALFDRVVFHGFILQCLETDG